MQTGTVNFSVDARVPLEAPAKTTQTAAPPPVEVKLEQKVDNVEVQKLQTELANHDISLKFSRDDTTNHIIVQMIDGKTGEAIRQFPTEVSLSLAANFMKLQGVFIDVEQ